LGHARAPALWLEPIDYPQVGIGEAHSRCRLRSPYRKLKLEHIGRAARPQGAMLQNPGQALTMLTTEVPILNLRDEVRGGFEVVGPSNLILLTVHTVDKGKPLCDLVK
jgi:hypothetical protein